MLRLPVASSDNLLFSVRNILSDRPANLSSSTWGAVPVDVEVGVVDISQK